MLYRQFYQDADTSTLRQLYVTSDPILNMHVKFGTHLKRDIDILESVQKFALRVQNSGMLVTLYCACIA